MPIITVIVPVYNVEKYLGRCMNSILNQSFKDLEVILINDGSTDGSGELCNEYASQYNNVRVFHKNNGGLSSARNLGLNHANSPYISFIDSDDWIAKDTYEYMMKLMLTYDAEIVSTRYLIKKDEIMDQRPTSNAKIEVLENEDALKFYMQMGISNSVNDYSVCTKLYKKDLFNDICFPIGQYYEDVVTNFKLIKKAKKYIYSDKVCYYYFQENTSITRNKFSSKDFDMEKIGLQLIAESKELNNLALVRLAEEKLARNYMSMLYKACKYGIDNSLDDKKVFKLLQKKLNDNFWVLLKSRLQISRKILTLILRVSPRLLFDIFRFIERRRK
ncbi:MAG TPA: hypothetical protein DEF30_05905 [Proteiniclasticum sp.]|uniref:glycosyltransferase family 2 protein n=1 Tax=Proteiniclasticum sp. TaxID=2053595 RepID=UPI000E9A8BF1|nr:glycosyltransferase family 2 protein [Proteiniclasticum sp.]HBW13335.1 hypothetical protein [Proteiniclasticum sp.]